MPKDRNQGGGLSPLRPDVAAAAARVGSRLRDPGELVPITAYLGEDETVTVLALGSYERGSGVMVLTDARVLFFLRGVRTPSLDLVLGAIGSVTTSSGLSTGEVALGVGEQVVAVSRIVKGDVETVADAVRRAVATAPPLQEPASEATGIDPFEAMEKLAALRDAGVLTGEEFAAKKQQLLDRL